MRSVAAVRIVTIAALLVVWELVARSGLLYRDVVPPVSRVAWALLTLLASADLYRNLAVSLGEIASGFAIGGCAGVACGILFGARRFLGAAAAPYVDAFATTPKIVFLPIVMLMVGIGPASKVALGALSAFFPIVLSTAAGMRSLRPVLVEVAKSFNASALQTVRKVYLPALVWPIIAGLRLGLGVAVIGVLLGEIKMSNAGLGYLANDFYSRYQVAALYALLIVIFALAALANAAMSAIGRRFQYTE